MHKDLERSLATLNEFKDDVQGIGNFADRMLAATYEDFVDVLYNDINNIVGKLEENPELIKDETEDQTTSRIMQMLWTMQYDATHDTKNGGHCDLLVKKKSFQWIGEAKKHQGATYVFGGFQQLTTRYSTGSYDGCQGAMLIYIRQPNVQAVMKKWADHLKIQIHQDIDNLQCEDFLPNSQSFYSTHLHQRTGLTYKVKHIPLNLYFNPKD